MKSSLIKAITLSAILLAIAVAAGVHILHRNAIANVDYNIQLMWWNHETEEWEVCTAVGMDFELDGVWQQASVYADNKYHVVAPDWDPDGWRARVTGVQFVEYDYNGDTPPTWDSDQPPGFPETFNSGVVYFHTGDVGR
ncbi:MAG: hypothetical protein FJY65_03505 [Calditrichaeota bacterium]|nr:hypothetical protein [Calditrichota bacterium]